MFFDDWRKQTQFNQISKTLLWEYDLSDFDWQDMKTLVIQRVIERGWMKDFYAAIRFYGGIDRVRKIIKGIPSLCDKDIAFVCTVFNLKKEELKCYRRKQLRKKLLSS
ncbi:MAG: hypothetical protein LBT18_03035 [Endomicrobium sp.]|nr:hypothetical protein [Endomicrobium sp.]